MGQYLAFYIKGTMIECRAAFEPQGPWSAPMQVCQCLGETAPPHSLVVHPELETGGGRVQYLTYVRPVATGVSDIRLIQLRFLP